MTVRRSTLMVLCLLGIAISGCAGDPNAKKAKYLQRSDRYLAEGQYNEAIIELRNALQIDPRFAPALRSLGRAYRAKSWHVDAVREFQRAADLAPDDIGLQAELGQALIDVEAWDDARVVGEAVIQKAPDNVVGSYIVGAALLGRGDAKQALAPLAKAAAAEQPRPEFSRAYGDALASLGRFDEAKEAYRAALARDPKHADALVGLGRLLLQRDERAEADRVLTQAKMLDPASTRVRLALSALRSAEGRIGEAIKELEEVPGRARSVRVVLTLAALYGRANRFEDVVQLLGPMVSRRPNFVQGRYVLGHSYLALGRATDALAEFRAVVNAMPQNPLARYSLALAHLRSGRPAEAIKELAAVAKPLDQMSDYHLATAQAELALGRIPEALKAADRAQRLAPQSPRPLGMLGAIHAANRDLPKAHAMYARALEIDPKFAPGHLARGYIYSLEKKPEEALREYDAALQDDPALASAIRAKVTTLVAAKRHDEAIAFVQDLIKTRREDARTVTLLGRLYRAKNDPRKATEHFRRALALDERFAPARYELATLALADRKDDEALGHLQQIIKNDPKHIAAALLLAQIHSRHARYEPAIAVLEPVAQAAATEMPALALVLADIYVKSGRYDDAIQRLGVILNASADLAPARMVLGLAYLGKGHADAALKEFQRVERLNPRLALNHYLMGRALLAKGDATGAKTAMQQAVKLDPKLTVAHIELAAMSGEKPDDAMLTQRIDELKAAVANDSTNIALRNALARAYVARNERALAEAEYNRILAIAPTFTPANYGLAVIRLAERKPDEAAEHLKTVVRANPNHVHANVLLADYYQSKANRELALRHIESAHRADPTNVAVKIRLAELYGDLGRTSDALARVEEVIKTNPRLPKAHLVAGVVHLKQGDVARAVAALTSAARLDPNLAAAHLSLAAAYERTGDTERAAAAYRKVQSLRPKDAAAYNNLAYLYASRRQNLTEALTLAQRAAELAPDAPEVLDTLGFVHYTRGDYAKAEPLLRKAADHFRNNATVQYHLGMTYYRLGRKEDAGTALRRALQLDEKFGDAKQARRVLEELGV